MKGRNPSSSEGTELDNRQTVILRTRSGPKLVLVGASLLAGLLGAELALRLAGFEFHLRPERITFAWKNSLASLGYRGDPDLLWVPAGYSQAASPNTSRSTGCRGSRTSCHSISNT